MMHGQEIMVRGGGFDAIAVDVAVLAGFVVVFMIANAGAAGVTALDI